MSADTKKVALIAGVVLLVAMSARAANNAEQVVFSTSGSVMTLSDDSTTPFGFWIWCAAGAPATSKGGYLAANACQGSMYFYAIDHNATGVIGQISEPTDGFYAANVVQGTFAQLKSGDDIFDHRTYRSDDSVELRPVLSQRSVKHMSALIPNRSRSWQAQHTSRRSSDQTSGTLTIRRARVSLQFPKEACRIGKKHEPERQQQSN